MSADWMKLAAENKKNAELMAGKTKELAPDDDTPGVALEFYSSPFQPTAWSCGDKPTDPQELAIWNEVREQLKTVPVAAELYPNVGWDVFATSYDPKKKVWPFIDKQGGIHTVSLEAFEKHAIVVNLKNRVDPVMIKTLNYKEHKGGRDILQAQAYANNVAFDPHRAATPTLTRVIPAAPPSGGSGAGAGSSDAASAAESEASSKRARRL